MRFTSLRHGISCSRPNYYWAVKYFSATCICYRREHSETLLNDMAIINSLLGKTSSMASRLGTSQCTVRTQLNICIHVRNETPLASEKNESLQSNVGTAPPFKFQTVYHNKTHVQRQAARRIAEQTSLLTGSDPNPSLKPYGEIGLMRRSTITTMAD